MRLLIPVCLLPIICQSSFTTQHDGRGSRPTALATAFVAWIDDPWLVYYNPSGMITSKTWAASAFVAPGQFGMSELSTVAIAATAPLTPCSVGIMFERSGFTLYRETSGRAACAFRIQENVSLGLAVDMVQVAIERYGNALATSIDFGASIEVTDQCRIGYCWKNVTAATIGSSSAELPQLQSLGLRYGLTSRLAAAVEIEKEIRYPFVIKGALEQNMLDVLTVRLGCSTNPDRISFGISVIYLVWDVSYALFTHQYLGLTHQFGVTCRLGD